MNLLRGLAICSVVAALGLILCTDLDLAGGSSSTDNGRVYGMICRESGLPAAGVQVTLRPSHFDPYQDFYAVRIDTTDATGDYAFTSLPPGSYTVEAVALADRARALVASITVDSSTTYAPVAVVAKPGVLKILVPNTNDETCYIYIPGTSRFGLVHNGVGVIDSVPAGRISAVRYADLNDPAAAHTIKTDFSLLAGATREIADYSAWRYSQRLFFNTTVTGADISGVVTNFPVLVRLTDATFDFGQAQSDGSDLRFKKSDDTPLAYEIERWDAAGRHAEIWVLIDTIIGNDKSRYITLHWGNPEAKTLSSSAAVFDTAAGFEAVWHLAGIGTATVYDATANGYHGTPYNMNAASMVDGAIGAARSFNGTSSYITMPNTAASRLNFPEDGAYTMSLWVYADTIDTLWRAIAGKGHEQYYMQFKGLGHNRATWEFVEFQDQRGWEYTEDSVPPSPGAKQWIHIVGVRSGTSQQLYINGKRVVDAPKLMPGEYARNSADNFSIGRFGRSVTIPYYQGWSYFKGRVDEVRVCRGAMTADWIKLCYMNQKSDDALIVFEQ